MFQCDDTRDCIIQFCLPEDEHMCSKHVEAWNKLITKFSASSWLILINKLTKSNGISLMSSYWTPISNYIYIYIKLKTMVCDFKRTERKKYETELEESTWNPQDISDWLKNYQQEWVAYNLPSVFKCVRSFSQFYLPSFKSFMNDWQNITINTARSIILADEFEDSERLTSTRRLKKV